MDKVIEKKKGLNKKHLPYILGGVFLIIVLWLVFSDHSSTLRADKNAIAIGEAVHGDFNDYIRIQGQVQPITTVQLSPLEDGVVDEILIEEGARVKKGDVIIRLSNPTLTLSILDGESMLAEKQNSLRNTEMNIEQEKLSMQQNLLEATLGVERTRRKYEQNGELYKEKLIAREEYLQSKEDYELSLQKKELLLERRERDSLYRLDQLAKLRESLGNMTKNMELTRQRMENLNVKSPIDGELGLLDAVRGQSVGRGQKIGQINDLSDYMVQAMIDEHYIDKVTTHLDASFERQGARYSLETRKVYPEVRENKFRTDLVFSGERPENIRLGQTYYIDLQLGEPSKAIMIPRGSFYQATGGNWVYVISPEGDKAYKRAIKIGRQNPQYYEVTEGLSAGEKVITSSYDSFSGNDVLVLK